MLPERQAKEIITSCQCCGSGMVIPDHDFFPPRIPDLEFNNNNKKEEGNNRYS
jgi:hypothetical protein